MRVRVRINRGITLGGVTKRSKRAERAKRERLEEELIIRIAKAGLGAIASEATLCETEHPHAGALEMMEDAAIHVFCAILTAASRHDAEETTKSMKELLGKRISQHIEYHLRERWFPPRRLRGEVALTDCKPKGNA
jgi:hypothetical protein